jgi:leader peptidase (prepilin peptidase)/N-methyltransferase
VLLRGHCRDCRAPIPLRYPLVEFLAALLVLALLHGGREPREALLLFALGSALIVVTFIDLDHRIIPDAITIPFIVIAPAAAFLVGHITVKESLAGALVGGGLLWAIARLYALVRKQEGMGLGDVKLLAMIGGLQGWQSALFTLGTASVSGAAVGLLVMAAKRGRLNMEIPFGPFLALGAVVYMFAGPALIAWYLGLPPLF